MSDELAKLAERHLSSREALPEAIARTLSSDFTKTTLRKSSVFPAFLSARLWPSWLPKDWPRSGSTRAFALLRSAGPISRTSWNCAC